MNTVAVTVPDPMVMATVTVDWDSGATSVSLPPAVVNIPITVGVPGRDGVGGLTEADLEPPVDLTVLLVNALT